MPLHPGLSGNAITVEFSVQDDLIDAGDGFIAVGLHADEMRSVRQLLAITRTKEGAHELQITPDVA